MPAIRQLFPTLFVLAGTVVLADDPGVISTQFLNSNNPRPPSCHASTIEETPNGLIAAWFGGTHEKNPDVGIWVVREINGQWTAPVEIANGIQYARSDGSVHRHPTWNPVLFQYPDGPLMLFYKCGPSPRTWWGMVMSSPDCGETWTIPVRLPEHIDGPVRNKPILMNDGTLLCGSSTESDGWRVHFELTQDRGATWKRTAAVHSEKQIGAIQPTFLQHTEDRIEALCRNRNGNSRILTTSSTDNGKTWTKLKETSLPNPNSGIDAVTLKDGRHLLIYNHTNRSGTKPRGREMINIGMSDDGVTWKAAAILDKEPRSEFSYPAVIQSSDGMVHVTYTWKRQLIRHVRIDPSRLVSKPYDGDRWPF
ncbi:MAG: exo-alpha-sialidase [Fuerstiella sp.]|nr:exo-alpha-sialidase [Fuerstiella sp.]